MQPAAVIFDMDGVLIDSEPLHLDATNEVLAREGAHLTPLENEPFLGTNELAYWRALVVRFGLAEDPEHYVIERKNVLIRILRELLPVSEGIPEFLARLADRGVPMAVASGSGLELVRFVVEKAGLGEYLPVLASGEEVENPKPAPDVFLLAAERLGVEAGSCLVFEDSPNGVRAALAAGMTCVRVVTQTTRALEFPSTHGEIDSFVGLQVDQITGGSLADPLS